MLKFKLHGLVNDSFVGCVDLAIPMQANLQDTVKHDDTVYQKFFDQHADTSGPDSTSSRTSKGSIYL